MNLETMLTKVINQKENGENRLILGFNNGFYLALEKRDNQIKQELLQWHGKPSITTKFSREMQQTLTELTEPKLRWAQIYETAKQACEQIIKPLRLQEYTTRKLTDIMHATKRTTEIFTGRTTLTLSNLFAIPTEVYNYTFNPEKAYRIANKKILKTTPNNKLAAVYTNGKATQMLDKFSTIIITFKDRTYFTKQTSQEDYFFATQTENWHSRSTYFMCVEQKKRETLQHCAQEKGNLINEWHEFKKETDKKNFTRLLYNLEFIDDKKE